MSTLQMERGGAVRTPSPAEHRVPDHIPADIAAEHPDAASVVAREPLLAEPAPYTVRTVERGLRRTRAGFLLALAVCAVVAALVGGSGGSSSDTPVTTVTAGSTTTASSTPAPPTSTVNAASATCPPGTSVVVQCGPSTCAPVAPWSPFFGPCGPSRDSRR